MAEYIKCEKAVEILKQKSLKMFNNYYKGYMQAIKDLIDECPTADVEPVRRGHWIDKTIWHRSFGEAYHECSVCHAVMPGVPNTAQSYKDNYCCHCGAKMDAKMGGKENG